MNFCTDVLQKLRNVVGFAQVLVTETDLATYSRDGRGAIGNPGLVVRPATSCEVVQVLRIAFEASMKVVPQGGRTGLVKAGIADEGGAQLVLSLDRLKKAPIIDVANRSAVVAAGTLLSELNDALAPHGLCFPIDLGADPSIGGMVAANTGGARFLRYGDVRRNLMALELVTAETEPRILTLGSPLWKDNSSLAIEQLVVGSSGALGVVTSATLALSPVPANAVTAMLALPEPDTALDLLIRLEQSFGPILTAFEGMSRNAFAAAIQHVARLRNPFSGRTPPYCILVELSGGKALEADWLEEQLGLVLMPMLDNGSISDVMIDRGDHLWAIRHAIPEGLRAAGAVVACDISLRRGDVMRFRNAMLEQLAAQNTQLVLHDFGHIGDGGLHFNCVWPHALGPLNPLVEHAAREAIFTTCVEEFGGTFSAEHGIGPANEEWYARFTDPLLRDLSGKLQDFIAPVSIGRTHFGG